MLAQSIDPWRFQWHVEVWVLVASLSVAYVYMVRVIGPKAVPTGQPAVTRVNVGCFVAAMAMLWAASDWPIHDIGEEYLYSVHMLQHMMLSYFLPPLVLMATPEWLLRVLIGQGRLYRCLAFACRPVAAAIVFNAVVVITHIPGVVNASVGSGALHYTLHFIVVLSGLLMWMPVVGPFPELQLQPLGKCIYLFVQSLVPTIPAAWLTFAEGTVYEAYDQPVRVWSLSIIDDQQLAGAVMKTGGGLFLWSIIVFLFFKRFAAGYSTANTYRRERPSRDVEPGVDGDVEPGVERGVDGDVEHAVLTTEDIEREFARTIPPGREE